ncbi:MAG: M20/M25/M40 family metallo-hydrolase [Bacteroidetes bacterium]|nr:M20/M25/M40 family metallo-hydrolase [Bacteroidota bacterium]
MNRTQIIFFILFLFTGFNIHAQIAEPEITTNELEGHVYFLASDELEGRKPGTEGGMEAATYIRDHFISFGLQPIGENGFQYFNVTTGITKGIENKLVLNDSIFELNIDFIPMPFSSNADVTAEVVFAGFGFEIDHDSLQWNDYKDLDAEGKWVLMLRGDPEPDKDESLFISSGSDRDKALLARDKKAAGVLLVNGPQYGDKLLSGAFDRVTADAGIPVINISQSVANLILENSGKNINDLEKEIIKNRQTASFSTGEIVSGTTELIKNEVQTQNVVAIIEGTDPTLKNEYIVIGAHYDHLGFGGQGSGSRTPDTLAIHNGADDNASGTAGIIELAEKLSSNQDQLKRSIVIMAFGAEEMGLLGSQFFTSNALVDLKDVKAMFNFDMIGRLDTTDAGVMVAGTGTAVEFESLLASYEEKSALAFNHSPEGYGASDHASFYASNVPVLFFTTGAHPDYHTPDDDADKINYEGQKEILDYAYPLILDLANRDINLTYQEAGPKERTGGAGRRGLKVKLGIMPDFTATENDGLGVGGVTAGGPASKSGMLKGDKIVAINGMTITNIYDYMNRLKKLKPGETISVDIMRNGNKKVLVVVL